MRLRFDFWRFVSKGDTTKAIQEIMEKCSALPAEHDDRLLQQETKVVRLHRLERHNSLWFGDFVGIGTKRPATKAHVSGRMEQVPFQDDEGLGEENVFLYDPSSRVFVLQSNRLAATASCVVKFFERFAPIGEQLELDLQAIMNPTAIESLSRFQSITSLRVNMAAMDLGKAFGDKGYSANHLASIAADLNAPSIKLDVSVGHGWRKQGLAMDRVKSLIQQLMSVKTELKGLEISGRTEDEDFEALDLVTQRLKEVVNVAPDEGRAVSLQLRWGSLHDAFKKHEPFLSASLAR